MFVGNIKVYVGAIEQETEMIKKFVLYPESKEQLPPFSGGSHITTYIEQQDQVIERHYSLVSDPLERNYYAIAIRRDDTSRGGSVYWHDKVKVGDKLEISFPKNHFPISFKAKHHVFYAAGIGITPFLTMMADLKAEGKSFELHYAGRSKELCGFYDFIQENYSKHCKFYFSKDKQATRMSPELMLDHPIGTHVYFCGPNSMVTQFAESALSYGYPAKSIHFELFAPPKSGSQQSFQVVLNNNQVIDVPEDESLLDTLLKCGVNAPYSCRVGGCGGCLVEVLEGEADHRDFFYSDEEKKDRNIILTCVSRAKSNRLVLNL